MEKRTEIQIPYGDRRLSLQVPQRQLLGEFCPKGLNATQSLEQEVRRALQEPVGCPPVHELVRFGEQVVLLIDDHTRSTPTARVLPIAVDQLLRAGIRADDIRIMVARGTHRPLSEEELVGKVGSEILGRFRVSQHDCYAEDEMIFVGLTCLGTPVWVNRLVVKADRRIGIGHIGPSPYAGYSGAGKLIVPGVASIDTVNYNHSFVPAIFRQTGQMGETEDWITRRDIDEAASLVGLDMVVDVVLNQNGEVVQVFAGASEAVFREGLKLARKIHEVGLPFLVPIAIASGNPYSIDLYQAMRAVEYADNVVRDGGAIVLVADCPDGVGDPEFYHLMADGRGPEDFLRAITRRSMNVTFAALGYNLARIKADKRIYVVSDHVSGQEMRAMGFLKSEDLQATTDHLLEEYGPAGQMAVFPMGSVTIPRVMRRNRFIRKESLRELSRLS